MDNNAVFKMDNSGRLSKFAEYVNTYGIATTGGQLSDTIREVQVLMKRVNLKRRVETKY